METVVITGGTGLIGKPLSKRLIEKGYNVAHLTRERNPRSSIHFFFPNIPAVVLKIIFGKMSGILLNGSKVSAGKIIAAGYSFQFPELENALRDLLKKR